ncbi:hypothetical protein OHA70_21990 [Kribbella sp. NBC_00382]|uniref:hypothetical protein n=1 Tax=Kribbella sp. NBC_00382 TaxID=2975967 RepID=UPI002E23C3E1
MSNNWYTDNRQNRELEDLRDQMAAASSEASNLRSRLSQVQGTMETRLQRLTTAFDAFVELSDIRESLIGFADAAEVRRHAGQVLAALASGQSPTRVGRDVPAYWLAPAVEAIRELGALDEAQLAEAMKRDEVRTSTFLCLALAALGRRNEVRAEWLSTAFGQLAADGTVTRTQRALWTAAARGGFGAEGQHWIVTQLKVGNAGSERWAAVVKERATGLPVSAAPPFKEFTTQFKAGADLARLRAGVEAITGDTSVLEPDGALAYAAGSKPDPDNPDSDSPDPDSTSALLRLLISEGSEPEREMLARVGELRAKVTNGSAPSNGALGDSAGELGKLLEADLGKTKEPHLAATALRVVAAVVLADAEDLAKTASLPTPTQVSKEIEWRQVTLTPDGADRLSLAKAELEITQTVQPLSAQDLRGPIGFGVVGLLVVIGLGFLVHPFWIAVGLVLIGIGGYGFWAARKKRSGEQADTVRRIGRLREQATAAGAELAAYKAGDTARLAAVTSDLEEVRKRLQD